MKKIDDISPRVRLRLIKYLYNARNDKLLTHSRTMLRPVVGTHRITNINSAMARFRIKMLVVLRIFFWNMIVSATIELPIRPTRNVMPNVTATRTATRNSKLEISISSDVMLADIFMFYLHIQILLNLKEDKRRLLFVYIHKLPIVRSEILQRM